MKKLIRLIVITIMIGVIMIFGIPLLINILFKYDVGIKWSESNLTVADALSFYGCIFSLIGTISLGVISVWQTKKANNISEKVLRNELIDSTVIPHLQNIFNIELTKNKDTKITMSTHHKMDYGAIIATEPFDENTEKFNQYLMDIYFKCSGNGHNIKEMLIDDIICAQDPSKGGLKWEDNSEDPIPLKFDIEFNNKTYLNWTTPNEFFIQIKIYCEPNKIFDTIINSEAIVCLMFDATIISINGIKTKMRYKIWLENFCGVNVIKTNSSFIGIIEK